MTARPAAGENVTLKLDWGPRYRRMRMHTALHLLSAVLPYAVTGGSVGESESRLDFDIPEAGLDKDELSHALNDPAVKDRLRREVDAAVSLGVFGSPYIVVDGEPFWGADRLDQVEKWLSTGGW